MSNSQEIIINYHDKKMNTKAHLHREREREREREGMHKLVKATVYNIFF